MNIDLCTEAEQYGSAALAAFANAGGDELVQAAEKDPFLRRPLVEPVLIGLGALELAPRESADELEAAAALCRSAGWWALPYPVAERLARPSAPAADGLIVVADTGAAGAVAGLDLNWMAADLSGRQCLASPLPYKELPRETQFVVDLALAPPESPPAPSLDLALGLVLASWTLLGLLDRAMKLTRSYVTSREQFGQPLARFQGVQFQLTDAEVERAGVEELAKYTLWSIEEQSPEALHDALALRLASLEAAEVVFRICHQLHGAMGFCDESTLSWLSRYSRPLRQLPWGQSGTLDHLSRCVGRQGIAGLFSEVHR